MVDGNKNVKNNKHTVPKQFDSNGRGAKSTIINRSY